jgi:ferredoxin-NADP reductase
MSAEQQQQSPVTFETHVDEIIRRTHDVKSFRFRRPEGFDYRPGQWVTCNIMIEGISKMHHFTISSSPTEDYLEFTKKITDHPFSVALDRMKPGDWMKIRGPMGDFTFTGEYPKIGFLSGGIGITPLRSMMRYIVDKKLPTDVKMLYANKAEADIAFRDEIEVMMKSDKNIMVRNVLSREPEWKELKGHIDGHMIREQIPDFAERTFYICGPPSMNEALKKALKELDVPDEKIRLEQFTGYE